MTVQHNFYGHTAASTELEDATRDHTDSEKKQAVKG